MSSVSSASTHAPHARPARFQRNLRIAVSEGRFTCGIESHYRVRSWTDPASGRRFTDVERRPLLELYRMMVAGQTAQCECLIDACTAQWNRNFTGHYTTTAIMPGSLTKGIDNKSTRPRKIYSLPFSLDKKQFDALAARFPERYLLDRHPGAHDHPIAHVSAKIAAERLWDRRERGTAENPKVYIDLHGNPGANESYMQRNTGIEIITVVEAVTPKDYLRMATKWGPEFAPGGRRRWLSCSIRDLPRHVPFLSPDAFVSFHTLYYYDKQEVCNLLECSRVPLFATMHRFEHRTGELNYGEQRFDKRDRHGLTFVYQTNRLTGATYSHPDNNMWFESDAFTCGEHGVAWDASLLCDETFCFDVVYCPQVQCDMSPRCHTHGNTLGPALPPSPSATAQSQSDAAATNTISVSLCGVTATMPIESQHLEFYGAMRKAVIGRPRTAPEYRDHVSRCKIKLSSLEKAGTIRMDAQQLSDIARASFFIDFCDQYGADSAMFSQSYMKVIAADSMYKNGGGHITTGCLSTLCEMLLAAHDAKSPLQAVVRSARVGLLQFNRKT